MAIWAMYVVRCDLCGRDHGPPDGDRMQAGRLARRDGWRFVARPGSRQHDTEACPECQQNLAAVAVSGS